MFTLNPHITIQHTQIPNFNASIWIIDDCVDDFDVLLRYINNTAYFNPVGADGTLFPGMRDNMPKPYYRVMEGVFSRLSEHPEGTMFKQHDITKCWLSKVTLTPEQLDVTQTMPHFDSLDANHMAAVHYLQDNNLGGTSFYRYKATDKIQLSHGDKDTILKMIEEVKSSSDSRSGYINDTDTLFEKVFSIEAKPNRLVLYSGNILHSANITTEVSFDKKSPFNRTTINSFFCVK